MHSDDICAVTDVLESGMIAAGEITSAFEDAVSAYIGRRNAAAVSSGTAALYAVLTSLGISEGDKVIVPAYVCSSLLYAVRLTGADPVVADSGDDPFHMDVHTVKRVFTPSTKAVVFPHLFGAAFDISDIVALGVPVIEDCALSIGSRLDGILSGNLGSFAAVFSFYATKVMTTGEGGMVVSDDTAFIDRIRDMVHYADKPDGVFRFNFAMTDIAAALGLSQLGRLDDMIRRRRALAAMYTDRLSHNSLTLPVERPGERHIFYRYVVGTRHIDIIRDRLREKGVVAERPVHTPVSRFPGIITDCPRAEEAWRTSLSIPLYPALTDSESETVVEALMDSLEYPDRRD